MSMYEVEDLMEQTIRTIDQSEGTPKVKRNLMYSIYALQNKFDCSFTHFRVMDILMKNGYVQQYNIQDFPIYDQYSGFFNALPAQKNGWVHKIPTEKWSESNPAVAYWNQNENKIFVDFGTAHYTLYPEEKPQTIAPLDLGHKIIQLAHAQKDKSTIYDWTAFMINYILGWFPQDKSADDLIDTYFSSIKSVFVQYDYTDFEFLHIGLSLSIYEGEGWQNDTQIQLIKFMKIGV